MPIRSWIGSFGNLRTRGRPVVVAGSRNHATQFQWGRLLVCSLSWWFMLWAAWAVRLWRLDASDLTFDEVATFVVAHRPLLEILSYLRGAVREHPPVYYLLMHPWMSLAGISEYSLRFFAAGASMLGIGLTARLARQLARRSGIVEANGLFVATFVPALLLALFPFEVYYARDARMYTLTIVWAALSSLLLLPLLFDRKQGRWPSPARLAALVCVNSLAIFTHYYLALFVLTQFVALLLLRRWRAVVSWSVAHGLVGLVGLAWLARSPGLASTLSEAWGRFVPIWPTLHQLRRFLAELLFGPIRGVPWSLVYSWGALVALGLTAAWLRSVRENRTARQAQSASQGFQIIGPWLTVTILLPLALAFFMPEPPRSRFLIFVLPFMALALGQIPVLFDGDKKTVLGGLALTLLAISTLGIYGLPRTVGWIKSNYGHTVATVSAHARPGDRVLFYGPWQEIQFKYYGPSDFPPITSLPPRAPPQLVPEEAEPVLQELVNTSERLWVIPAAVDDVDPQRFVYGWLNTNAHPVWTTADWSLYLPPTQGEELSLPADITFGDHLRLKRVAADAAVVPAGESLRLTLTWAVTDKLDGDVVLDFLLTDERNNHWRQWHSVPGRWLTPPSSWRANDVITDRQGMIVPQGAPPGRYTIQVIVLDMDSGAPLRPSGASGSLSEASVDLLAFEVVEPISTPVLTDIGSFEGPFHFKPPNDATEGLTLAGYELGGLKFTQGNPIEVQLHWLAPSEPIPNAELRLQLLHRSGLGLIGSQVTALITETFALAADYPVSQWPPGRLVSQLLALSIPADATAGRADLTLAVLGPDGRPWAINGRQHLTLSRLAIEARPVLRRLPAGLTAVQVDFDDLVGGTGDRIALRGYRIDGEARPGGQLFLNYAWQAQSQPQRIYSVFNHLLTPDGHRIAQADGWPQSGKALTSQWRAGEYIPDSHTLDIPADAPPGPYLLVVGLYDAANGKRLHAAVDGQTLLNNQWQLSIEGEYGE